MNDIFKLHTRIYYVTTGSTERSMFISIQLRQMVRCVLDNKFLPETLKYVFKNHIMAQKGTWKKIEYGISVELNN